MIEVFGEYANISKATHSTGNDYVCPFLGIEDVVDGLARPDSCCILLWLSFCVSVLMGRGGSELHTTDAYDTYLGTACHPSIHYCYFCHTVRYYGRDV